MAFTDLMAACDRAVQGHLGGVAVTWLPGAGGSVALTGMFDESYILVDAEEPGRESVGPSVWLSAEELAKLAVQPDDEAARPKMTINGTTYVAHESQPEGLGGMRFLLHKETVP